MRLERHHWFMLFVVALTLACASYVTGEPVRIVAQFGLSLLIGAPLLYVLHRRDQRRLRELRARIEEAKQLAQAGGQALPQPTAQDIERLQHLFARAKPSAMDGRPPQ